MALSEILVVIGAPVLRSIAGWAEKSLKDGKVNRFEVKQLTTTVVRVGTVGLVAYFGLGSLGVDIPAISIAASSWIFDKVVSAMKEKKSIRA